MEITTNSPHLLFLEILDNFAMLTHISNENRDEINRYISQFFTGMNYNFILNILGEDKALNTQNDIDKEYFQLEIRIKSCSLVCIFSHKICIESFLFWDDGYEDNSDVLNINHKKVVCVSQDVLYLNTDHLIKKMTTA